MTNANQKGWGVFVVQVIQFLGFVMIVQTILKARGDMFERHPEEICRITLIAVLYGLVCMHDPGTFWNISMSAVIVLVGPHIFVEDIRSVAGNATVLIWLSSVVFRIFLYLSAFIIKPPTPPTVRIQYS